MTENITPPEVSSLHQERQRIDEAARRIIAAEVGIDPTADIHDHLIAAHITAHNVDKSSGVTAQLKQHSPDSLTTARVVKKGPQSVETLDYNALEGTKFKSGGPRSTRHEVDYSVTRSARRGIGKKKTTELKAMTSFRTDNATGERHPYGYEDVVVTRRGKDGTTRTKTLTLSRADAVKDALDKRAGKLMKGLDPSKNTKAMAFDSKRSSLLNWRRSQVKDLDLEYEAEQRRKANRNVSS